MDEADVAAAWSELLDGQPVTPGDDFFFDLGGNSLLGVAIVAELAEKTGLPLELRDLYLAPTPRELADYLDDLSLRLAALRKRMAALGTWSLDVFADALADLGAAAADSLLPETAVVSFGAQETSPGFGQSRVGVLRRARGNGTCIRLPGTGVALRRQDVVVVMGCAMTPDGLVVQLVEAPETAEPQQGTTGVGETL